MAQNERKGVAQLTPASHLTEECQDTDAWAKKHFEINVKVHLKREKESSRQ
jgi:hypothetical protein